MKKKIMAAEAQFSQSLLRTARVSKYGGKLHLVFPHLANYGTMAAEVFGDGYLIKPFLQDSEPDFLIYNGVVLCSKMKEHLIIEGNLWSLLNLSDDLNKTDGNFYLRRATQKEAAPYADGYFNKPSARSGQITVNSRWYHVSAIDFAELFGMPFQRYWKMDLESRPQAVMSVVIKNDNRYITLKAYEGDEELIEKTGTPEFKRRLHSGEKLSWLVRPTKDSNFTIPNEVLKIFGMPSNYFLPTKMDWETGVLKSEAPIESCACCGKDVHAVGDDIRRGKLCQHCEEATDLVRKALPGVEGEGFERAKKAVEFIIDNPDTFKKELISLAKIVEGVA